MSDHLIAEANRHTQALPRMQLPTTQPTHSDIAWYAEECANLKKQLASLARENAELVKQRHENAKLYFQAEQVRIPELLRENSALRAALQTALGIEAIDEESLNELVTRCKSIINNLGNS